MTELNSPGFKLHCLALSGYAYKVARFLNLNGENWQPVLEDAALPKKPIELFVVKYQKFDERFASWLIKLRASHG